MFSDINISQGSVATPLRCGGICNDLMIPDGWQTATSILYKTCLLQLFKTNLLYQFFGTACYYC